MYDYNRMSTEALSGLLKAKYRHEKELRKSRRENPSYYADSRKLLEEIAMIEAVIYARDHTLPLWEDK